MPAKYIAFDFETGGLDPIKNQILTGYFVALDKDLNILGDLDLKIKSDPEFTIDKQSLEVNKIDLEKHNLDPKSLTFPQAKIVFAEFLNKFGGNGKRDKNRPRLLGHNSPFDKSFLWQLAETEILESKIHYGLVCTKIICDFFKDIGVLPDEIGTLDSLIKYFEVPKLEAHIAKNDVLMTVGVYGKLIQMVKGMAQNNNGLSLDILSMLEK